MSAVQALRQLRELGATFAVLPTGEIEADLPDPLPPDAGPALEELRAHRDEVRALLQADTPALATVHPCVVCRAETSLGELFCGPCWTARLRRSPRFCEHKLAAWDPIRKQVLCGTCTHELVRNGSRFVLAAATTAKPDAEPPAAVEIERGAARGGAR